MSGGPQVVPKPFKLMLKSYTFDWMIDEQRMFSLLCAELILTALLCFTQRVKYTHLKNRGAVKNSTLLKSDRLTRPPWEAMWVGQHEIVWITSRGWSPTMASQASW